MTKRIISAIILPSLILALAVPVSAQRRRETSQPVGPLDLSDEQLIQLQELRIDFQKEILPIQNDIRIGQMELNLLNIQNTEQEKITDKVDALKTLKAELDTKYEAHQQQIRGLLTDEQKVIFDRFGGLRKGLRSGRGFRAGSAAWGRGRANPRSNTRGYTRGTAYSRDFGRGTPRALQRNTGRGFARGTARGVMRGQGRSIGRMPLHRRWWIR